MCLFLLFLSEMQKAQYAEKRLKRKLDDLMFYGDSTNVHFHSLAMRSQLCKKMFHTCGKKYMWTYDVSGKKLLLIFIYNLLIKSLSFVDLNLGSILLTQNLEKIGRTK